MEREGNNHVLDFNFFSPQMSSRYSFCRHELFVNPLVVKIL
jgi:hypothetical protein